MAMMEWRVTPENLRQSANKLESEDASYNSEWAKLYEEVNSLRSSQWQGIASDTFNDRLEGYRNDFEEMSKIIKQYVEFLRTAADEYEKTEENIKEQASNLYVGK